ncbi:the cofilin homology domain of Hip-55 [Phakopsora pachyrhizi]|nr:the cofilin homology domain of Hip-55 [Phakopsora pachyrhizi]
MAQVRISDPVIGETYQCIIVSNPHVDFMLLTYVGQTNNLKIQEKGTGRLEGLEESWSNGRMHYAFVGVKDIGSGLIKFVLIVWCGNGVLKLQKGLFHLHASSVSQFLRGYHVQINT